MHKFIIISSIYFAVPLLVGIFVASFSTYMKTRYNKDVNGAAFIADKVFEAPKWDGFCTFMLCAWPLPVIVFSCAGIFHLTKRFLALPGKVLGKALMKRDIKRAIRVKERDQQMYLAKTSKPLDKYLSGD